MNRSLVRVVAATGLIAALGVLTGGLTGCSGKGARAAALADANRYLASGDYDKAEIEYKNVLQKEALNPEAIAQLGIIYFDEGRVRMAVPYLLKARELKPENLEVRRKVAALYAMFGKSKEAREEAKFILGKLPTDAIAPLVLMEGSLATPAEVDATRQFLQTLPGATAGGAPVRVALGLAEMRQRNLNGAKAHFEAALAADQKFFPAYSGLAGVYRMQKDLAKTEQALKTASELAPLRSGKLLQYAQFKLQTGDKKNARTVLEELIRKAPDYLPAQSLLAEIAASENLYDESLAMVTRILSRDPQNPEAMLLAGRLRLAKGEAEKAATELEKMLKVYPGVPQALFLSGQAYSRMGDRAKAIERLTQAVKVSPTPEPVMALAALHLRQGDNSAAILSLKPLVEQHPELGQARMMLADAYRGQGNDADALKLYNSSAKDFPKNPQPSLSAGLTYLQRKDLAQARAAFEDALTRVPGYLPALEQLTYLDLANKQFAPAVSRLEVELKKTPNVAALHVLLAKAHMVQSNTQLAEAELEKAIELQPELTEAYYQLARLHIGLKQEEKALANLRSAIAKNPKDLKSLLLIGLIQDAQKDYPGARATYEQILSINPTFSPVLNNLAYLYSEHFNELDKAYDAAQKARDSLPNEPHVADTLGWILYKKGLYTQALAQLEDSAEKLPDEPEIRYHLGVTQYALSQEKPAKISLQRALEMKADAPWSDDARARLAILAMDSGSSGEGAVAALEASLKDRPNDPIILARLAAAYQRAGDVEKAVAAYRTIAKANPGSASPLVSIAELYAAQKQTAKALEAARAARKVAPDDVEVAKALGALAFQMGDYSWAANLLQDAARNQSDNPDLLLNAAEALYSVGKISEAETLLRDALTPAGPAAVGLSLGVSASDPLANPARPPFQRAAEAKELLELITFAGAPTATPPSMVGELLQKDPDHVPALFASGLAQEQQKNTEAAWKTHQRVLARYPEFVPAKLRLAVLAASAAEFDAKSLEYAQQARTAYPTSPEAARALGILMCRKGDDAARSITLLKQSLTANPADGEATYYLGLAQLKNKDSAAKASLQKAIDLGLRAELATDAKKKLAEAK